MILLTLSEHVKVVALPSIHITRLRPSHSSILRMGDHLKLLSVLGNIEEFFSSSSTSERNRLALDISATDWRKCTYFLANSNNTTVCTLSLTTLEHVTLTCTAEEKAEMYQQLSTFLDLHHATLPVVIRDKLVKLTMDIARSNWSRYSSEIFPWILSLVSPASLASRPASLQLGLVLLLAAAPPENLAATEIAELGQRIVTLLELCQKKTAHSGDSISSPAPDPPDTEDSISAPALDPAASEDGTSTSTCPGPSQDPAASVDDGSSDPGLDPAIREVAELVLRCLNHIFSWSSSISASLCSSSALITALFQYSKLEAKSWVSFSAPISINNKYSFLSNTLFRTSVRSCQWNAF